MSFSDEAPPTKGQSPNRKGFRFMQKIIESAKLKSCPHCGSDAELACRGKGPWWVSCKNTHGCGASVFGFAVDHHWPDAGGIQEEIKQRVVKQWNRRAKTK